MYIHYAICDTVNEFPKKMVVDYSFTLIFVTRI